MAAQLFFVREPGFIIVRILGYFDGPAVTTLREKLLPMLHAEAMEAVCLDLSGCPVINSVAIGNLLALWEDLEADSAPDLHFFGVKPLVRSALEIAGFPIFARFWSTEQEARSNLVS